MADMGSVEERVKKVVSQILGIPVEKIKLEHKFVEDLDAESIQSVELMAAFEEEFDIEMDEEQALAVKTVSGAVEFIEKCIRERKP